jgi:hypothetical protein
MKVVSFTGNKISLSERTGMCIENKMNTNLKPLVTTVNSVCISLWVPSLRSICSFLCSSIKKVKSFTLFQLSPEIYLMQNFGVGSVPSCR